MRISAPTVVLVALVVIVAAAPLALGAGVVSYQGRMDVDGSAYTGPAQAKLAIVDSAGTTTYWSNDGTSVVGDEPVSAVPLTVTGGLFEVLLGDTTVVNMTEPLPGEALGEGGRYLRVWLSTDSSTFTLMVPDRRLADVPSALQADLLDGQHASDFAASDHNHDSTYVNEAEVDSITSSMIVDGTVTVDDLSDGATLAEILDDDGAGSGLDADLLDGLHASAFTSAGSVWGLQGNSGTTPGTDFLGTPDNQALEVKVNGTRALRLEPGTSPNLLGGYSGNWVAPGVFGAAIGGGGQSGNLSRVVDHEGTIGGGQNNQAGSDNGSVDDNTLATVGGGANNVASGTLSTIAGGTTNTAGGYAAAIGGGRANQTSANYTFLGGGFGNETGGTSYGCTAVVGGQYNTATGEYAFVGGGAYQEVTDTSIYSSIVGGSRNSVITTGWAGTVGGGYGNLVGGLTDEDGDGTPETPLGTGYAVIGGGRQNTVTGSYGTVSGGRSNTASGGYATVAGGLSNVAVGTTALAAGRRAKANFDGCFVWGDSTDADVACSAANQFVARASGGAVIYTNAGMTSGVTVAAGGGSWASVSDRNLKTGFAPVNGRDVLERVVALPISTWSYRAQDPSVRHIGPMAQDFAAAFAVGEDETHITNIDAEGVALAAIQGLAARLGDRESEIETLTGRLATLEAQNAELQARLEALEARLGTPGPVADRAVGAGHGGPSPAGSDLDAQAGLPEDLRNHPIPPRPPDAETP